MSDNGYQEYTGDRHTLPRANPVAMPRVVEELNMIWQNQNGGDHTSSPMRGRCASQSASATTTGTERLLGTSVPNLKSPLQQMTGSDRVEVEAGIKPSMFGGTLRRKKPPVARPPQEKKTEQETSGADTELAKILNRRRRKNGEVSSVQNVETLDKDHHETKEVERKPLSALPKIEKPRENPVPPQEALKSQPILISGNQSKQAITDAGSTIAGTQAIKPTEQGFQLHQKFSANPFTSNVPEPTISSTATRLLHDEKVLCVAHEQNHTRVDPQAARGGTIETKVEAFKAHEKPGAIQNQREGLNIGELPNHDEEKQDNTDQTVRRLQDGHTRMEGELKLQHEETRRLEQNYKRQIDSIHQEMQEERKQFQDEQTRMKGELNLQQEEKCRLELNYKRQIGNLQEEMQRDRTQLRDEHTRMVGEMKTQHQDELHRLEHQVHTTQNSVQRNGRDAEIKDLRSRLEAAHEHVAKQNDTIVQMTFDYEALQIQIEEVNSQEIVKDLEGKVEHYQIQVSQYENDFNEERAARERAVGEQASEKRRHQFEMQVLEDNLKEAVESERTLKQHATTELDELRRKQAGLEKEFNKALAIQTSQLDAARAEKARLLTTSDQTWLDHQRELDEIRQQNDGLNHTVKKYEADIQQLLSDNERTRELDRKIGEYNIIVQALKTNLQRQKDQNQNLTTTNQELNVILQQRDHKIQQLEVCLSNKDELSPYILHQIPDLGECKGAGSYGSVHSIQLNGISCIAKRIHDILLGQGKEERVSLEDKRAAYQKFYTECVLLSRMRHPNIVQFMGVHYGPQRDYGKELTLVMERLYMNLEDCLKQYKNVEMWLRVSILLDISQGLLHLHSQGIIHRDLTAANVLLTTSFHAKIADLGVSRIINVHPLAASKQSMIPGALGYMPPEVLAERPEYGSALDIFSFGVLILFVLLQVFPQYFDNLVTPDGLIRKESHIQKRSKWINKLSFENPFRQLICDCLQDDPARRPATNNLNSSLIQIAKTYPKPYQDIINMRTHLAQPQQGFPRYS
ncbi:cyclin-dependent kinase 11B-like isoform X3 [Halichondria panicea]|uniref:cyclin-dependent kinase 11B-like isoform X3 n=1 Tax=Halichondria panicea TaxID=6063 RepID=UPI00312BBB89